MFSLAVQVLSEMLVSHIGAAGFESWLHSRLQLSVNADPGTRADDTSTPGASTTPVRDLDSVSSP